MIIARKMFAYLVAYILVLAFYGACAKLALHVAGFPLEYWRCVVIGGCFALISQARVTVTENGPWKTK